MSGACCWWFGSLFLRHFQGGKQDVKEVIQHSQQRPRCQAPVLGKSRYFSFSSTPSFSVFSGFTFGPRPVRDACLPEPLPVPPARQTGRRRQVLCPLPTWLPPGRPEKQRECRWQFVFVTFSPFWRLLTCLPPGRELLTRSAGERSESTGIFSCT